MRQQSLGAEIQLIHETALLDIVVPFTTPELTCAALKMADRLGAGLHAAIRLLKVQLVPFPLQQSPVHLGFLKKQLEAFKSALPLTAYILLARDFEPDLMHALQPGSIVILASKRRFWRTRNEGLAAALRRAGHQVVLMYTNNEQKELNHV